MLLLAVMAVLKRGRFDITFMFSNVSQSHFPLRQTQQRSRGLLKLYQSIFFYERWIGSGGHFSIFKLFVLILRPTASLFCSLNNHFSIYSRRLLSAQKALRNRLYHGWLVNRVELLSIHDQRLQINDNVSLCPLDELFSNASVISRSFVNVVFSLSCCPQVAEKQRFRVSLPF